MAKITVIALRKGGVGKTTTAQHLGWALADMGRSTLLVDLDPQASLTTLFLGQPGQGGMADLIDEDGYPQPDKLRSIITPTYKANLFLAPTNDRLAAADERLARNKQGSFALDDILRGQRLPFQHVIIDTPPGRSSLLTAALVAADEIVIPVQLSPMGFQGFGAIDDMVMEARQIQRRTKDGLRLRLAAVVPTFYAPRQIMSDVFMDALVSAEHPDYAGQPLPLADPIPETTEFEKASAVMDFEEGRHARTVFEMVMVGDSPTERGQLAYLSLADQIAGVEARVR